MTDRRGAEFARLVHAITVLERKWPLKDVAARMGMEYDTLYARVHKRTPFIAVDRSTQGFKDLSKTVHMGATRTVLEASDILREVERGLKDKILDFHDYRRIRQEIEETEQALATLRAQLPPAD